MSFANLEPVDRRATPTIVAETIRARIMDGTFAPGLRLSEAQLAERLGVSRGPVREAFQRLVQEGLLDAEPHRGVAVAQPGPADAADVARARFAIERAAVEWLVDHPDGETTAALARLVDRMAAAADKGRWAAVADADLRFHETLVAGAGSPRLTRMYATLLVETRLCLRALPDQHPDPGDVVDEHRRLLDALNDGDRRAAVACLEDHISDHLRLDRGRARA